VLEHPQDVHVRHADTELHEPARARAPESTDDVVEIRRDPGGKLGWLGWRTGHAGAADLVDSSHDVNNLQQGNHRVNSNDC
jgi:hypothetical protein